MKVEGRVYRDGPKAKGISRCGGCGVTVDDDAPDETRHVCIWQDGKWVPSTAAEAHRLRMERDAKTSQG